MIMAKISFNESTWCIIWQYYSFYCTIVFVILLLIWFHYRFCHFFSPSSLSSLSQSESFPQSFSIIGSPWLSLWHNHHAQSWHNHHDAIMTKSSWRNHHDTIIMTESSWRNHHDAIMTQSWSLSSFSRGHSQIMHEVLSLKLFWYKMMSTSDI